MLVNKIIYHNAEIVYSQKQYWPLQKLFFSIYFC